MVRTLSIVVPAFNEAENLQGTVESILFATKDTCDEFEVIIVDDGSKDNTRDIARGLEKTYPQVRILSNEKNKGLGSSFRSGLHASKNRFVTMVPGDNSFNSQSIKRLFERIGEADIISGYTNNLEVRPKLRRILSISFTRLLNFLSARNLKYFNGPCIFSTEQLKTVRSSTHGFAYMAEIMIQLLRQGATIQEVALTLRPRASRKSSAFRIKNVLSVITTIFRLFFMGKEGALSGVEKT